MEYDVILINPLMRFEEGNNYVEYLGFSYIAAYLRERGYIVKIIDMYLQNLSIEEVVIILNTTHAKALGFTSMSSLYISNIKKIVSLLHKKGTYYIVGGLYATQNYSRVLQEVSDLDFVFLGEGEKTWSTFLYRLSSKISVEDMNGLACRKNDEIVSNGLSDFLTQEEVLNLPRPAHDMLEISLKNGGIAQIAMSRGCYGNCSFCAISNYYKNHRNCKWRYYNVIKCVDELEYLVNTYDVKYVDFSDEEFIGPKTKENMKRLELFINEVKQRNIKIKFMIYCRANDVQKELFKNLVDCGLDRVFLGIEFGSDYLLKMYGKGIKVDENIKAIKTLEDLNIKLSVGYIMFEPFMNIELLRENVDFYFKYCSFKLDRLVTKMGIFPNTRLLDMTKDLLNLTQTKWDIILGDYYPYQFQNEKVNIAYQAFLNMRQVLSKSKSYYRIKQHSKCHEEYDKYFSIWKKQLHMLISKLLYDIENTAETNCDRLVVTFKNDITVWDNTYTL